jgi:outer membrane lipoprotein-sorting protein
MKRVLILLLMLVMLPAAAETPEEKGLRIAQEAEAYDTGFTDFTADMLMTLRNKKGDESIREIRVRTLEVEGDGDKSLSIFDRPRDVKGTAMLTYSHGLKPDDQWLYLPALKRVKRINSRNKSGPFMGSEFAYEDLSSQEIEKYTYKYLRDEACGDSQCYVIEQYPAYEYSGYTRRVVWLDQEFYRPMKVVFYDRKDALLKTLNNTGYQQYLDHYWRAEKMDMENHQTGKSTTLTWSKYQFKTGLTDRDFIKSKLKNYK